MTERPQRGREGVDTIETRLFLNEPQHQPTRASLIMILNED